MKLIKNPEYGLYEKDNQIFCDSLQVAETFGRQHKHILDTISKLTEPTSGLSEKFTQRNFALSSYKDSSGKLNKMYLLTKDGFAVTVMEFKTKKARKFKEAYIERFNQMEDFIKSLQTAKLEFPEFTNAIMNAHEEPKNYHFSNEINMINKIVLGLNAKQFKEQNNIDKSANSIRPYLTQEQIKAIETLQRFDIGLVTMEPDYQKRKEMLENYFNKINSMSRKVLKEA